MAEKINIDRMQIASPCHVPWETMSGNERLRHCGSCQLNVYNTADMTVAEIEEMIRTREGRLCIRIYRRADGTILTKDCPVGIRAMARRISRVATAAMSALFALWTVTPAQEKEQANSRVKTAQVTALAATSAGSIAVQVFDPNGAVVPGAQIELMQGKRSIAKAVCNDEGRFEFTGVPEGNYEVFVKANGFKNCVNQNVIVEKGKRSLNVSLHPAETNVVVGIFVDEPIINTTSSSITTVITRRQIERLPY